MLRQFKLSIFPGLLFLGAAAFAAAPQPHVELRPDPSYFSPNGDGFQDFLFFHPVLSGTTEVQRWRLDIKAKGQGRVARLSGPGLPALIKWNGLDKKGARLPEGEYEARLDVFGRGFHVSIQEKIYIDVQAPVVGLSLSTTVYSKSYASTQTLTLSPDVLDSSPTERWLIQILNDTGRTLEVFSATGPLRNMEWDGSDPVTKIWASPGKYRCAIVVWDKAGNESAAFFRDLTLLVSTREMLERTLRHIQVNETPEGLLVQLDANVLFTTRKKQLVWSAESPVLMQELAVLVNAYPNVAVKLEGYSKINKKAPKDRNLASVYAWRVYSSLVKGGHVPASRLSVRGRGRSAMFDRRAIPVPVISNGVEVFLEGKNW